MTSEERVKLAIDHKQPDKLPIGFGGHHGFSSMHVTCIAALREYYGLEGLVKVADPSTMTGIIDDDLKEIIGCDLELLEPYTNFFGFKNENWKEWSYQGITVLVPGEFVITEDGKGGYYLYPEGDISAPPSGHMPEGGFYFDNIARQQPFNDDELDYRDNLEEYKPVTNDVLEYYKKEVERATKTRRAVVSNFGYTALGDISLIPGPSLKHPKGIRSIEEWYMSQVLRPDYVKKVFEAQVDIAIENLEKLKGVVKDAVDIAFICGTDFGTQESLFYSKEIFETLYLPYYKRINDWIHQNTNWKTLKHSCGAIAPLIPSLIEAGFDILNPVQCSAAGMEPRYLKKTFGKDIVFWGAGVDTQKVLPFGTPEEVRKQVLERCEIFAPGGGFIFAAIHNVQAGTPVENIVAMIDAVHEFNGDR